MERLTRKVVIWVVAEKAGIASRWKTRRIGKWRPGDESLEGWTGGKEQGEDGGQTTHEKCLDVKWGRKGVKG